MGPFDQVNLWRVCHDKVKLYRPIIKFIDWLQRIDWKEKKRSKDVIFSSSEEKMPIIVIRFVCYAQTSHYFKCIDNWMNSSLFIKSFQPSFQQIGNAGTVDLERQNSTSRMQEQQILNAGTADRECKYGMPKIVFQTKSPRSSLLVMFLKFVNVPLIPLEAIEMTASNLNSTPGGYVWKQIVKIKMSYIVKKVQCVIVLWFRIKLKITIICLELLWDLLRTFVFKALAPFTNYGIADSIILHFSLWFTNLGSYLISGPSIS